MMGEGVYSPELAENHWWWRVRGHMLKKLADDHLLPRYKRLPRVQCILDIGCGTGVALPILARYGQVIGIDISPKAVELCPHSGDQYWAQLGDCYSLCIENDSVDAVVSMDMLEHLEYDTEALKEMYRVLMPGGILILAVPSMPSLWSGHDVALGHYRRYDRKGLQTLVESIGFYTLESRHIMGSLFPAAWIHRRLSTFPSNGTPEGFQLPGWINRTVELICNLETDVLQLPFGSSVFLVAIK